MKKSVVMKRLEKIILRELFLFKMGKGRYKMLRLAARGSKPLKYSAFCCQTKHFVPAFSPFCIEIILGVLSSLTRAELFVPYACGVMDTNWYPWTLGSHIFYVSKGNWLKFRMWLFNGTSQHPWDHHLWWDFIAYSPEYSSLKLEGLIHGEIGRKIIFFLTYRSRLKLSNIRICSYLKTSYPNSIENRSSEYWKIRI